MLELLPAVQRKNSKGLLLPWHASSTLLSTSVICMLWHSLEVAEVTLRQNKWLFKNKTYPPKVKSSTHQDILTIWQFSRNNMSAGNETTAGTNKEVVEKSLLRRYICPLSNLVMVQGKTTSSPLNTFCIFVNSGLLINTLYKLLWAFFCGLVHFCYFMLQYLCSLNWLINDLVWWHYPQKENPPFLLSQWTKMQSKDFSWVFWIAGILLVCPWNCFLRRSNRSCGNLHPSSSPWSVWNSCRRWRETD